MKKNVKEQKAVAYIRGEAEVPRDLQGLVRAYRQYAEARGESVSYPRAEDDKANRIYDALVVLS
jgi:hypothetical protein